MIPEPRALVLRNLIYRGSPDPDDGGGHAEKVVEPLPADFLEMGYPVFLDNYCIIQAYH